VVQSHLARRERTLGRKGLSRCTAWRLPAAAPEDVLKRVVEPVTPGNAPSCCSLASIVGGREVEAAFANAGHFVISNSKNYRMDATVPLMIPEIKRRTSQLIDSSRPRAAGKAASSPTRTAR